MPTATVPKTGMPRNGHCALHSHHSSAGIPFHFSECPGAYSWRIYSHAKGSALPGRIPFRPCHQPGCAVATAQDAKLFQDVPQSHWAYEAVSDLQTKGILLGYPDGYFRGKRPLTRYEFAVALERALKNLPPGTPGPAGPAGATGPAGPQGEPSASRSHSR